MDGGTHPPAGWQVGTHLGRRWGVHRQVQMRADEERNVQSAVDEEGVSNSRAEGSEGACLGEEGPGGGVWVAVLDGHLGAERARLLERGEKALLAHGPVRHQEQAHASTALPVS